MRCGVCGTEYPLTNVQSYVDELYESLDLITDAIETETVRLEEGGS
jgi:hypothetical protein